MPEGQQPHPPAEEVVAGGQAAEDQAQCEQAQGRGAVEGVLEHPGDVEGGEGQGQQHREDRGEDGDHGDVAQPGDRVVVGELLDEADRRRSDRAAGERGGPADHDHDEREDQQRHPLSGGANPKVEPE
ncbi:hypothetical protein GCM10009603_67030 [Nocardiopsis exhalans]